MARNKRSSGVIPSSLMLATLDRDDGICQMCGLTSADRDPCDGTPITAMIAFVVPPGMGGDVTINNLRVICSCCNEGLQNTALPKPDRGHLMSQIRRATIDDQQAALDWLLTKFGLDAHKKI